jgi:hypothetical protein
MSITKETNSEWSAKIDFKMTPEYPNEFRLAYAHGETIAELRADLVRVMSGLKEAGRTPTKFVVSKKVVTTWITDEQSFTELLK